MDVLVGVLVGVDVKVDVSEGCEVVEAEVEPVPEEVFAEVGVAHPLVEAVKEVDAVAVVVVVGVESHEKAAEVVGLVEGLDRGLVDGTEDSDGAEEEVAATELVATGVLEKAAEDVGKVDGDASADGVGLEEVEGAAVGVVAPEMEEREEADGDEVIEEEEEKE